MKIAVIGAGPTGLAAAFDLVRSGHEVTCYEAADQVGGLASGFKAEGWDWSLEKYYHHWFQSDQAIHQIARDLGIEDKLLFPQPVTALYHEGRFYAFDSPISVLRFPGIPFLDRIRFGFVGLYLRLTANWKKLEAFEAHRWLTRYLGKSAYQALWEPMLAGKFGEKYYKQVNMAWFWARIHARTRRLGTYVGGFQAFMEALGDGFRKQGGKILLSEPVSMLEEVEGGKIRIETSKGEATFDRVLTTSSPEVLQKTAPSLPSQYLEKLNGLKSLGAVVLVLALKKPLGPGIYWYNLPKKSGFPFLCLVEHTCFIPPEHYGGDHLIYCGDYVPEDHPYMTMTLEEVVEKFGPSLARINPDFKTDWIRKAWLFRTSYAQPVPFTNHSQNIPPIQTPWSNLYWASMSHVYPWDRGTNFAVELGRKVAQKILKP